jgi:hypothetical protein
MPYQASAMAPRLNQLVFEQAIACSSGLKTSTLRKDAEVVNRQTMRRENTSTTVRHVVEPMWRPR